MVRPVEGYLADDGTYFQTEQECEVYEAARQLQETCEEWVTYTFPSLGGTNTAYLVMSLMDLARRHADKMKRYADTKPPPKTEANDIRAPSENVTTLVEDDLDAASQIGTDHPFQATRPDAEGP